MREDAIPPHLCSGGRCQVTYGTTSVEFISPISLVDFCKKTWTDKEQDKLPSELDWPSKIHPGKPHSCVYASGHEQEAPSHWCQCGSEMTNTKPEQT